MVWEDISSDRRIWTTSIDAFVSPLHLRKVTIAKKEKTKNHVFCISNIVVLWGQGHTLDKQFHHRQQCCSITTYLALIKNTMSTFFMAQNMDRRGFGWVGKVVVEVLSDQVFGYRFTRHAHSNSDSTTRTRCTNAFER